MVLNSTTQFLLEGFNMNKKSEGSNKKKPKAKAKKNTPLAELIKANNYLHQYCDFLNSENQRNSMKCFELMTYVTVLEKMVKENHKIMEFIIQNLGPKTVEKMKKEFEEGGFTVPKVVPKPMERTSAQEAKPVEQKLMGLHDDITVKCPNCKSISTNREKACKECGFKI